MTSSYKVCFFNWVAYSELEVPWDSEDGRLGESYEIVKQRYRFAAVAPHGPFEEPSGEKLVGYPVHAFCWEMLSQQCSWGYRESRLEDCYAYPTPEI